MTFRPVGETSYFGPLVLPFVPHSLSKSDRTHDWSQPKFDR